MKKVCILLVGLPRTYERTYENFIENIIEANIASYHIDIYIDTNFDTQELKDKLQNIYNKYGQVKNIFNTDANFQGLPGGYYERTIIRIKKFLENTELISIYDFFMIYRMDQTINKPISFNWFENGVGIVCPDFTRPSLFHERDWTACIVGEREAFLIWMHFYSIFYQIVCEYDKIGIDVSIPYKDSIETELPSDETIQNINIRSHLKNIYLLDRQEFKNLCWESLHKHETYQLLFHGIATLNDKGYDFILGDIKNIFIHLVR